MGRRGNGEGSIYQRSDGRWCAAIMVEGKRREFYAHTRRDAQDKLMQFESDGLRGLPIVTSKQTVAQFFADWLRGIEPTVRYRTYRAYERYLMLHAAPIVGKLPLAKLGPNDNKLYASRLACLSPRSVRHLHTVIHTALEQAVRWQILGVNVANAANPPRAPKVEKKTFTHDEAKRFLAAASGDRLDALFVLALTTGMREGELLGLHWADVHLDGAGNHTTPFLRVRCSLQRKQGVFVFEEPKTRSSRRTIQLPAAAVSALRRHRANQNAERLRLGELWEDQDLVFANRLGRPIEQTNMLKRTFSPLLAKAEVSKIRFHDLRHTFATLALAHGAHVKQVSETLGHASIAITLDLYGHVTETMQDQTMAAMNALYGS